MVNIPILPNVNLVIMKFVEHVKEGPKLAHKLVIQVVKPVIY